MTVYDTFILKEFKDLREDEEMVSVIRDLTPGKRKYRSTYARIKVSKDAKKYPDTLWVRLGRGQLIDTPCSMKVIEFIDIIPKGM
jgi:hypothetical protein